MSDKANDGSRRIEWVADGGGYRIGYRVLGDGRTRSYCLDYTDASGSRVRTFKDQNGQPMRQEGEARDAQAKLRVLRTEGAELVRSKLTVKKLGEQWLAEQTRVSKGQRELWALNLRLHIYPLVGHIEVARIREGHFLTILRAKRAEGKAESTLSNIVAPLRAILDEAVVQRIVLTHPWERVPRKERPKPSLSKAKKRILTIDEVDRLIGGAAAIEQGDPVRLVALVSIFVFAGLRKSEALGLVWSDVDFAAGEVAVELQLDRNGRDRVGLKTDSSERRIPMSTELRQALLAWKVKSLHSQPGDFVFCTVTGTPLSQRNAYRMVTKLALDVGINSADESPKLPNMDVHSLRHVFASAMIRMLKGDAEAVAALTGHSDTDLLLKTYTHEFAGVRGGQTVAERAALIDAAFNGV